MAHSVAGSSCSTAPNFGTPRFSLAHEFKRVLDSSFIQVRYVGCLARTNRRGALAGLRGVDITACLFRRPPPALSPAELFELRV